MTRLARGLDLMAGGALLVLVLATLSWGNPAQARATDAALLDLENRWASAVYEASGRAKQQALALLLEDARKLASTHADDAQAVGWHGIIVRECILASCKSASGRLHKEARDALLKAKSLDAFALGGRIYANLGALYAQAPSTFGGFGSSVKGIGYLWSALVIDPESLESNFLYAEILVNEKKLTEAREVLQKASRMPARPEHLAADRGRQRQILALLHTVESRLDS